jgi:hypothetical protein
MNFNIKNWNLLNYVTFIVFCFSAYTSLVAILGGYVFASTIGEVIHQFVSKKSADEFSKKHNLRYDPKAKSYTKE